MSGEPLHENPWFRVERLQEHHRIVEPAATNAAAVLLRCPARGVLLLESWRPALQARVLEAPRGYGEAGESPAACAARELFEETGIRIAAASLTALGRCAPNSGILASRVHLMAGRCDSSQDIRPRSPGEDGRALWMQPSELRTAVSEGRIEDCFLLALVAHALLRGLLD